MTYRSLFGLHFKVWSPSLWELHANPEGSFIKLVTVTYDGLGHWYIYCLMKRGTTICKGPYTSLQQAAGVIAFGEVEKESA